MSTAALVMMTATMAVITAVTVYFFVKVLRAPPRKED